ncbi:MAG: ABC transporter ATP-binding protein [Flavobacteriales bacterium]|nr:ABC transporter ATP-binding protein [Flavobacteriales bacterium]
MLKVQNIKFSYPNEKNSINGISFQLKPGEIASIVGRTGAGKSTLLKCLAGFLDLKSGSIALDQESILGPEHNLIPGHPEIKHVAQDFNLLPNHSVTSNIGSELHQYFKYEKKEVIQDLLQEFSISSLKNKIPRKLSGGQQQRVALAKALAEKPKLLLLDEPFNQQDSWNKGDVLEAIKKLAKQLEIGIIMVTHQYEDALHISDHVWVMEKGKIVQKGKPQEVFFHPKSEATAELFGDYLILNETIIRPVSLKISSTKTDLLAKVLESRFKGNRYEHLLELRGHLFSLVGSNRLEPQEVYLALKD